MTSDSRTLAAWKRLLDACDHLAVVLQRRASGSEQSDSEREVREAREAAAAAADDQALEAILPDAGTEENEALEVRDRLLLGLVIQRYLAGKEPSIKARELAAWVADSSFERLDWLARLQPGRALHVRGFLVAGESDDHGGEIPEASLLPSDRVISSVLEGATGKAAEPSEQIENDGDLLARIRELSSCYSRRASRLFGDEEKEQSSGQRSGERERDRIEALEELLRDCFAGSTELPFRSPLIELVRRFRLSADEAFVVGHLLLEELIDGDPWQQAAQVLRMLARDEGELWELRRMLEPEAALRRHGLIVLEEMLDGRPLSADFALATWVVQRISADSESTIKPDERIDFHLYLKDLGDSESFFRRLDVDRGREER